MGHTAPEKGKFKLDPVLLARRFFRVAIAFFRGDAKWKARALMGLLVVFACGSTGMHVIISYTRKDFANALTEKNAAQFYSVVVRFACLIAFAAPFFAIFEYIQGRMILEWRVWLTNLLVSRYFTNRAFFNLKMDGVLDNPDQRICEDAKNFVQSSVTVIQVLVEKFLSIFAFSAVLWSISPSVVAFLMTYALLGTFTTLHLFGQKIMQLKFEGLQREADMRYSLVRVRDNVESIAFYRGEHSEEASVRRFLQRVVENIHERLKWDFFLAIFTNGYRFATFLIPGLVLAPRLFRGEVTYGDVVQTSMAFHEIFRSVTVIVMKFDLLSSLAAETERLESLLEALGLGNLASETKHTTAGAKGISSWARQAVGKAFHKPGGHAIKEKDDKEESASLLQATDPPASRSLVTSEQHIAPRGTDAESPPRVIGRARSRGLSVQGLRILLPKSGEVLFPAGLSFSLEPEQSLLIMGPSGCGKSSLLRVISGLWKAGDGVVESPGDEDTFFLPQKPYMPLGSLREQLLFPHTFNAEAATEDKQLLQMLRQVSLPDLAAKFPSGLDEDRDWSATLSVGEQQRVAFARLLVHRPNTAFLDEATSALDAVNEKLLYTLMKETIGSFVSVGHRLSLVPFHSHVLWYHSEERIWQLTKSRDFSLQHALTSAPE